MAIAIGKANIATQCFVSGDRVEISVDVKGDTSYPTGGTPITPQMFGLDEIHHLDFTPEVGGAMAVYDYANSKMKIFPTTFKTEAGAASNQSALIFRAFVVGKGRPSLQGV